MNEKIIILQVSNLAFGNLSFLIHNLRGEQRFLICNVKRIRCDKTIYYA